jgi:hypothetical protein
MNGTVPPPPPGAEAPKKKGLSPLAWFAIGCGALIVLGLGSCFVMTAIVAKKAKSFVTDLEQNPDAAAVKAAELAMRLNPEVEVVSSDPKEGTLTVREKATGKEVTFTLEDIKAGKLTIESGGEKVNVDVNATEQGGSMTVTSDKGTMVIGGGDGSQVPDWVPGYPGAKADSFSNVRSGGENSGTFSIHTQDSAETVIAFYETKLKAAGFEVEKGMLDANGAMGGNLVARSGNRTVNVTVATQEGATQGLIAYTEKP